MPTCTSASRQRARAAARETAAWAWMASIICVSTRNTGFSVAIGSWKIIAMRRPRTERQASALLPPRSWPSSRMRPPTCRPGGSIRPMIDRPVIDLPEPDSPTRPSTWPRRTVKETSCTARTTPCRVAKWVLKPCTCRTGAPESGPALNGEASG